MSSESESHDVKKMQNSQEDDGSFSNTGFTYSQPSISSEGPLQFDSAESIHEVHDFDGNRKSLSGLPEDPFDHNENKDASEDEQLLGSKKSGWKSLSSLEKSLSIALGLVSALAVALMIAVIVVGVKLNKDDYKTPDKLTEATIYPPWVTTMKTTPRSDEVTTRERPTWPSSTTETSLQWHNCASNQCLEIVTAVDTKADPCKDFYQYACGGWVEKYSASEENPIVDQSSRMRELLYRDIQMILESNSTENGIDILVDARSFYETCMNQGEDESYDNMRQLIEEMLMDYDNYGNNLIPTLGKLRRELGANYILTMWVDFHLENKSQLAIYFDHSEIGLDVSSLDRNHLEEYKNYMTDLWTNVFPEDSTALPSIIASVIQFEKSLLEISTLNDTSELFVDAEMYPTVGVISSVELSNFDNTTWRDFQEEVFAQLHNCSEIADVNCVSEAAFDVIINDQTFYGLIDDLINSTEPSVIGNYLKWRVLLDYGKDSNERFRSFYDQKILGMANPSSRSHMCVQAAVENFGPALMAVNLRENVEDPLSLKEEVFELAEELKQIVLEMVNEIEWVNSTETREIISSKIQELEIFALYPLSMLDENTTVLEEYFVGLNLSNPLSHLQNTLDLVKWRSESELKILWDSVESILVQDDMKTQTEVEISHSKLLNAIYIPLGSVALPIYNYDTTRENDTLSLKYGSLGMMIGRMLIDVVESTAVNYINGTPTGMWDSETFGDFESVTDCLKSQYESYNITELNNTASINGEMTLKSNTMDVGGFKVALRAYARHQNDSADQKVQGLEFSSDQLFYIGFAQNWCKAYYTSEQLLEEITEGSQTPAMYRVKTILEDSPQFSAAWNCPVVEDQDAFCSPSVW